MTIGASDATIRTLVLVPISTPPPYCKALVAKLFFHQILGHEESPSISISDLVTTVATYFDMCTAVVERKAEKTADSIRDAIFRVTNMIGIGFLNSRGKPVAITDPYHRPNDITYFTFRANIYPHLVDMRAPDSVHLFEFSLRLPHTFLSSSASLSVSNSISNINTPAPVDTFDFTLSKMSDDDLQSISASQIWQSLSARRNNLPASDSSDVSRTL